MFTRSAMRRILYDDCSSSSNGLNVLPKPPEKPRRASYTPASETMADIEDIVAAPECSQQRRWSPRYWRDHLDNIRVMRAAANAPVDTMGCAELADTEAPPAELRFQTLVALMLSSQTKDEVTAAAMQRLKAHRLTIDSLLNTPDDELEQLLHPVSFYKRKTQYLKSVAQTLKDNYGGDIPKTAEELCQLHGVGPKMAHLCMQVAWQQVTGIGVDTHVHRIVNRLGWVPQTTKDPEQTRKALEEWLPRDLWMEVNKLLVGFGQTTCQPLRPKCSQCLNRQICPFGVTNE